MHKENLGHIIYIALYGASVASTVILYNSANLSELIYMGLVTITLGVIFVSWSSKSRKKVSKEALVESGMYAFIRHPEFLGHIIY